MSHPDPRAALVVLVARLSTTPKGKRSPVVVELLPLLADARIPASVRVAAAARVLAAIPDRTRPVSRVARALTVGLAPSRALARLRELQNQLVRSVALDELIDTREKHIRLSCPRCRVRLLRVEMVKHLWHEHGLHLHRRKTRSIAQAIEELKADHSATGHVEALDQVAELAGEGGLRKWIAEEGQGEEATQLLASAAEHDAGLCPSCLAEVPVAIQPLPPALVLAKGRLSGDGYAVTLGGNAWVSTLAVTTPDLPKATVRRRISSRLLATLLACLVLIASLIAAPSSGWLFVWVAQALLLYFLIRFARDPRDRNEQAIDTAWQRLAPEVAERTDAVRFLTRLCLASLNRGDPEARTKILGVIATRAAGRAEESDAELQLLAAATVLQVEEAGRFGRDAVAGVADLAATGLRGERSADFTEFVVAAYLTRERDPGDIARLQVLLVGAAFEAGLVPRDLRELWQAAPNLNRVMAVEPAHRLGFLYGLWRTREARAWEMVGVAVSVFELARTVPRTAAGVLARFPDLLLHHRPAPEVEALVGSVLVCARGVAVGEKIIADPDAEVRVTARGRELVFGRHRIAVGGRLPAEFADVVKAWLQYRADELLPLIDGYLAGGGGEAARRVLGPFCRKCLACGTISAVGRGMVGRIVT